MPPPLKPVRWPSHRLPDRDFLSESESTDEEVAHRSRTSDRRTPSAVPLPPSRQSSYHDDDDSFSDSHTDTSEDEDVRRHGGGGAGTVRANRKLPRDDFSDSTESDVATSDEEKAIGRRKSDRSKSRRVTTMRSGMQGFQPPQGSSTGVIVIIVVLVLFLVMGGLGFLAYSQGWPPFEDKSLDNANDGSTFDAASSMNTNAAETSVTENSASSSSSSISETTSAPSSQVTAATTNTTAATTDTNIKTTEPAKQTGSDTHGEGTGGLTTMTTTDAQGKTTTVTMNMGEKKTTTDKKGGGEKTGGDGIMTLDVERPGKCKMAGDEGCAGEEQRQRRRSVEATLTAMPAIQSAVLR
ncbi:hypothetical protein ACM66B_002600 [Microbotryomycetes sp. NB124-2]